MSYEELVKKIRGLTAKETRIGLKTQAEAADAIEQLQSEIEYTSRQYELALEDLEKAEQPGGGSRDGETAA